MNFPELFINVMRERTWSSPSLFESNFEYIFKSK